jgi:diguanylate cyclase (GGDEF)-like protein
VRSSSKVLAGAAISLPLLQIGATATLAPGFALTVISDIVSALLILGAAVAFGRNARSCAGRLRSVWILQSLGWLFWLADLTAWFFYDAVLRKPMPAMFPGDILLFAAGIPMLAGFLLRPHLAPSKHSASLGIVDFLQLFLWWIYFYFYLVVCWLYVSKNLNLYNRNYDRLYGIETVVEGLVLGVLIHQSRGPWRRFYALFLCAAVLNACCVAVENRALEIGSYYNGDWHDVCLAASFAFFIGLALISRGLVPSAESVRDQRYGSWIASLAALAALSLPIIIIGTMTVGSTSLAVQRYRIWISAMAAFLMALLVFSKQWRLQDQLRRANTILQEAALTDPLTGVRNRRFFAATVEDEVARTLGAFNSEDHSLRDLIFYLIDLDNFKEVNDKFGHDAGDQVLIEATKRIASAIRSSDVLLRWGGEEFLIVSRQSDRRRAHVLADRVLLAVKGQPFALNNGRKIHRTCSIGWAAFPGDEQQIEAMSYEEVLNLADRALMEAKRSGKDRALGLNPTSQRPFRRFDDSSSAA